MGWRDERPDLGKSFDPPACSEPAWRPEVPALNAVESKTTGFVIWQVEPRPGVSTASPAGPVHVFDDLSMGSWVDHRATPFDTAEEAIEQIRHNALKHRDPVAFTVRRVVERTHTVTQTSTSYEEI